MYISKLMYISKRKAMTFSYKLKRIYNYSKKVESYGATCEVILCSWITEHTAGHEQCGGFTTDQIKLASYNGLIYDMTVVTFKLHLSFPL